MNGPIFKTLSELAQAIINAGMDERTTEVFRAIRDAEMELLIDTTITPTALMFDPYLPIKVMMADCIMIGWKMALESREINSLEQLLSKDSGSER